MFGGINLLFPTLSLSRCHTHILVFGRNFYSGCVSCGIGWRKECRSLGNRACAQSALHPCVPESQGLGTSPRQSKLAQVQRLLRGGADVCLGSTGIRSFPKLGEVSGGSGLDSGWEITGFGAWKIVLEGSSWCGVKSKMNADSWVSRGFPGACRCERAFCWSSQGTLFPRKTPEAPSGVRHSCSVCTEAGGGLSMGSTRLEIGLTVWLLFLNRGILRKGSRKTNPDTLDSAYALAKDH